MDLWIRVLKDRRRQTSTDTERHRDIGSLKNPAVVYCTDRLCGESSQTCAEEFGSQKWRKSNPRRR